MFLQPFRLHLKRISMPVQPPWRGFPNATRPLPAHTVSLATQEGYGAVYVAAARWHGSLLCGDAAAAEDVELLLDNGFPDDAAVAAEVCGDGMHTQPIQAHHAQ